MSERRNVLVFLTDQQRHDTIRALGNPVIRTPSLDRLCREGTAFTSAYAPAPVCVPARCSLYFGQYPQRTGCFNNGFPMPRDERPTVFSALRDAGYRSHGIGKCHFTPDGLYGFETRERQEELCRRPEEDDYLQALWAAGFGHVTDPHGVRGELLGDYGCYGKRSMHDAAARVPLIARLPGRFPAGARCERPASLVDVAPTALPAAGVEEPDGLDGVDLAALAAGGAGRDAVFGQIGRDERAIYTAVTDRWKYAYSAGDDREFLFDRVLDPAETRDRAGAPFHGEALAEMRGRMIEHLRATGHTEPLEGEGFRKQPLYEMPENPDAGLLIQDHPWADQRIPGYTDEQ